MLDFSENCRGWVRSLAGRVPAEANRGGASVYCACPGWLSSLLRRAALYAVVPAYPVLTSRHRTPGEAEHGAGSSGIPVGDTTVNETPPVVTEGCSQKELRRGRQSIRAIGNHGTQVARS